MMTLPFGASSRINVGREYLWICMNNTNWAKGKGIAKGDLDALWAQCHFFAFIILSGPNKKWCKVAYVTIWKIHWRKFLLTSERKIVLMKSSSVLVDLIATTMEEWLFCMVTISSPTNMPGHIRIIPFWPTSRTLSLKIFWLSRYIYYKKKKEQKDTCNVSKMQTSNWQKKPGTNTMSERENWIPEKENNSSFLNAENLYCASEKKNVLQNNKIQQCEYEYGPIFTCIKYFKPVDPRLGNIYSVSWFSLLLPSLKHIWSSIINWISLVNLFFCKK